MVREIGRSTNNVCNGKEGGRASWNWIGAFSSFFFFYSHLIHDAQCAQLSVEPKKMCAPSEINIRVGVKQTVALKKCQASANGVTGNS